MKNTSKICTSIEQSKKLIELGIDVNTADMCWIAIDNDESFDGSWEVVPKNSSIIATDDKPMPCWSLSALLDLMPHEITIKVDNTPYRLLVTHKLVHYTRLTTMWPYIYSVEANTTLDAAFEVICELLEDKII